MFVKIIPYYTQIFVSPYPGAILGAIELITSFRTAVYCDVECTVCVLFSASRYNVVLMQRTCTNSKVKWICKTIFQRNKIFVGIQYWQNIIVDVIYIKKLKKKSQFYDFVIFFSLVFYKKKKNHSLYALCQCLTEKAWRLHRLVNSRWLWRSRWKMGRKLVYLSWKVSIHRT